MTITPKKQFKKMGAVMFFAGVAVSLGQSDPWSMIDRRRANLTFAFKL